MDQELPLVLQRSVGDLGVLRPARDGLALVGGLGDQDEGGQRHVAAIHNLQFFFLRKNCTKPANTLIIGVLVRRIWNSIQGEKSNIRSAKRPGDTR